jgi:hypothetical protein
LLFFERQTSKDSSTLIFGDTEALTGLTKNEAAKAAPKIKVSGA